MNYGETLAYWYLRLNGFFPVSNYVLHRGENTIARSADCDILAARHPHVHEEIGGLPDDWDRRITAICPNIFQKTLGAIVEVKTGVYTGQMRHNIQTSFSPARTSYAVKRLGFFPSDQTNVICEHLNTHPHFENDTHCIVKLLIADIPEIPELLVHQVRLEDVDGFISQRFERYQQKFPDRHFFPSDLMQYMIWKSTIGRR